MEITRRRSLLLGAAVLALLGGLLLYLQRDTIAADAIRKYGTAILGVNVKVRSVGISVASQSAELRGLVIENPPGFKGKYLLSLDSVTVSLDVSTLARDVVLIREVVLVKPEIGFEKLNGKSNLDTIQANVDRYISETEKALGLDAPKNEKYMSQSSKKWIIGHFYMRDGKASLSPDLLGGKSITVPLPSLHIRDIGRRANGASTADATRQVLSALTSNVTGAAGSAISGAAKEVGSGVKKGVSGIGRKLKGLFGK